MLGSWVYATMSSLCSAGGGIQSFLCTRDKVQASYQLSYFPKRRFFFLIKKFRYLLRLKES